ncbi:MAG: iron export ABC transporter permease subunit FetB [Planctomycetota bacterium]|nr:iron export ABC transporter permease subunit FetB [Planctomycetota bacterium]
MAEAQTVGAIELSAIDLAIAGGLVLVAGVVSVLLRLGLEKRLLLAAVRTVVQLLMIGYVLKWVFDIDTLWAILPVVLLMILAAGHAAVHRSSRTFPGVLLRAVGTLAMSGFITTVIVTGVIVGAQPWYEPQYLIPLLGMVLGNGLTGISLSLDTLLEQLVERRDEVELHLALGATRWEAARDALADAVRRGMIPTINSMMVVGIVALPGMMTGQILAGADPLEAVKYQVVVMFMIAGATSTGCIIIVLLAYRRLFTPRHQLDSAAIRARGKK